MLQQGLLLLFIKGLNFIHSVPQGWKLVPADGMVRCSTTCQWDSPWDHINLLRPCGGSHHTDKETNPNVIVELKNGVNLAGLIITKRNGNEPMTRAATLGNFYRVVYVEVNDEMTRFG